MSLVPLPPFFLKSSGISELRLCLPPTPRVLGPPSGRKAAPPPPGRGGPGPVQGESPSHCLGSRPSDRRMKSVSVGVSVSSPGPPEEALRPLPPPPHTHTGREPGPGSGSCRGSCARLPPGMRDGPKCSRETSRGVGALRVANLVPCLASHATKFPCITISRGRVGGTDPEQGLSKP